MNSIIILMLELLSGLYDLIIKRPFHCVKRFFIKYQIGILILFLGIVVLGAASFFNNFLMGSLGISIITTGMVSQIIKLYFEEQEKKIFPIKKDIDNVFEKRSETYKIILDEMEKSGRILMLGTAHRSFLWKESGVSSAFYHIINKCDVELKIILANPFCEQFIRRALIEEKIRLSTKQSGKDFFNISVAVGDIKKSMLAINEKLFSNKNIKTGSSKRNLKINESVKFSNDFPLMWLIITDDFAFFQPYQYGNLSKNQIMGENFFVLQIRRGVIYDRLESHFKYLWDADERANSNCSYVQVSEMMFTPENGIQKIETILKEIEKFDEMSCPIDKSSSTQGKNTGQKM